MDNDLTTTLISELIGTVFTESFWFPFKRS
nr:MAG TPA: hypothetical protein [Caudoviricetes sp.]DAV08099.1 MAG TPA: hypothetical protein [Caudoviricetes sp.]